MKANYSPYYLLAQRSALTDTPRERGDSHTETLKLHKNLACRFRLSDF